MTRSLLVLLAAFVAVFAGAGGVMAQELETVGAPTDWQWDFQGPNSPIMEDIHDFYDVYLLPMMVIISVIVLALMAYIMIRFRRSRNPEPTRTTHNTILEVIWTSVPVLILVIIAIPSLRLLYDTERLDEADVTIKATGNQWFWSYEYPDYGLEFDAYILEDEEPRLLVTDTQVVVPVNQVIRVQLTSADVIHAWALPAAGVKMDAVPGRLNELQMTITDPGIYYGQCSELCGYSHGFMPIMVVVMEEADFEAWVSEQQAALGIVPETDLAAATQD
mgnify:FL=1